MKAVRGHHYLAKRGEVFYFRRAVPEEAKHLFDGRSQVWQSLETSELSVARSKLQPLVDHFEGLVAKARGEIAPSKIARAARVPDRREIERVVRAAFEDRRNRTRKFDVSYRDEQDAAERRLEELRAFIDVTEGVRGIRRDTAPQDVLWQAEAICEQQGWPINVNSPHWPLLTDMVARSQIEAAIREVQELEGRPEEVRDAAFPKLESLLEEQPPAPSAHGPVPLMALFEEYVTESQPSPATVKSFRSKVRAFVRFLGHDDAARLTKRDVVRWKDHLLANGKGDGSGLSAKSVKDGHLPAIRAALNRGADSGQLAENVAVGITVARNTRRRLLRSKSFTAEEAEKILTATLIKPSGRRSPERALAIRWVPWLCAYTGARVNEITQLRREDVAKIDGIWSIRITPEAGSTKDAKARTVALHPHLIEQGFIAAISKCEGPIFYDPSRARNGSDANPQMKKVGEMLAKWVREEVGIVDRDVQPNHAWRHKFKTVARDIGMPSEIRDYIQGHVPRTEGEAYGEVSVKATFEAIRSLPRYDVATGCTDKAKRGRRKKAVT